MALYKDKDNGIHDDMGGAALQFFPEHLAPYTLITDEEAEALRPTKPWSSDPLLNRARSIREECLNRLAGIGLIALADGDSATVYAVKTARQSLLDITDLPAVKAATNDDELTVAITAAYADIVAACAVGLRSVFKDVII